LPTNNGGPSSFTELSWWRPSVQVMNNRVIFRSMWLCILFYFLYFAVLKILELKNIYICNQKCSEIFFKISKFLYMIHVHSQKYKSIFNFFFLSYFLIGKWCCIRLPTWNYMKKFGLFWGFIYIYITKNAQKNHWICDKFSNFFCESEKKLHSKKKAGFTSINLNGINHKVPCAVGLSVNLFNLFFLPKSFFFI
jgi:hypothetical protein